MSVALNAGSLLRVLPPFLVLPEGTPQAQTAFANSAPGYVMLDMVKMMLLQSLEAQAAPNCESVESFSFPPHLTTTLLKFIYSSSFYQVHNVWLSRKNYKHTIKKKTHLKR